MLTRPWRFVVRIFFFEWKLRGARTVVSCVCIDHVWVLALSGLHHYRLRVECRSRKRKTHLRLGHNIDFLTVKVQGTELHPNFILLDISHIKSKPVYKFKFIYEGRCLKLKLFKDNPGYVYNLLAFTPYQKATLMKLYRFEFFL